MKSDKDKNRPIIILYFRYIILSKLHCRNKHGGAILSKQSIVSMETVTIDTVATIIVVLKQTTLIKSYLSMRYFKRNVVTHL